MNRSTIGVYGLGVMGKNLALNFEEKGNTVSVYNRMAPGEEKAVRNFISEAGSEKNFNGTDSISGFVESLEKPRKILLMIKAGKPVDSVIEELLPLLSEGDILIDGGNSNFHDTNRRTEYLNRSGILFAGMGVSGGEEGARHGPSLMPGGSKEAWELLKPVLEPVAAQAFDGSPCCAWMGEGGAGHFVKMAHNGIEYADMQLIAEACHLMQKGLGMDAGEISECFAAWNESRLSGYLTEITSRIFSVKDEDGNPLLEKILDHADQKGTGKWTAVTALDLGIPLPGITESVYSRFFSSFKEFRRQASGLLSGPEPAIPGDRIAILTALGDALLASRMVCHAESFFLITESRRDFEWDIKPDEVARIWQGGCIIRSELLKRIVQAYRDEKNLRHLLLSPLFSSWLKEFQSGWRKIVSLAVLHGIPLPAMTASLNQYDILRSEQLPANLIQAQRDYFGAHTYERTDKPRGEFFHTDWASADKDTGKK